MTGHLFKTKLPNPIQPKEKKPPGKGYLVHAKDIKHRSFSNSFLNKLFTQLYQLLCTD